MFKFYSQLTDLILGLPSGDSLDMPLVELPVLLEPFDQFPGQSTKTDWEMAARQIYYTHFKEFLKVEFNEYEVSCSAKHYSH